MWVVIATFIFIVSKEQIYILKAMAIVAIVLHNFYHFTNDIGENEMIFAHERIFYLFDNIFATPSIFISAFFTYFGHFGVQIFIFASGYGLMRSYIGQNEINYKTYLVRRLPKLYKLFLFSLILFFITNWHSMEILDFLKLSFLSLLFLPFKNYSLQSAFLFEGPWWYFTLAVQLYLLFPLLFCLFKRYGDKVFVAMFALSYLLIYASLPISSVFKFPVFANFIGHLPEFLLGIYMVSVDKSKLSLKWIIPALIVFIVSNFSFYIHPFSFLCVTILMLCISIPFTHLPDNKFRKSLLFIGKISMFMFIVNPIVRSFTLELTIGVTDWEIVFYGILHFLIVVLVSYLLSIVYDKVGTAYDNLKNLRHTA